MSCYVHTSVIAKYVFSEHLPFLCTSLQHPEVTNRWTVVLVQVQIGQRLSLMMANKLLRIIKFWWKISILTVTVFSAFTALAAQDITEKWCYSANPISITTWVSEWDRYTQSETDTHTGERPDQTTHYFDSCLNSRSNESSGLLLVEKERKIKYKKVDKIE